MRQVFIRPAAPFVRHLLSVNRKSFFCYNSLAFFSEDEVDEGAGDFIGSTLIDDIEGALQSVGAVCNVFLTGNHAINCKRFYIAVNKGERDITDGIGVLGNKGFNLTCGSGFLVGYNLLGYLEKTFKSFTGTGSGVTGYNYDLCIRTANVLPVGDFLGINLGNLISSELGYTIIGINNNGNSIPCYLKRG